MFQKLSKSQKQAVKEMMELFEEDPSHPSLRNHPLDPPLDQYRSISIDGDLRILYRMVSRDEVLLLKVGTHEAVYTRVEK